MAVKCSKYGAGDLREAVTFQRLSRVTDGAGGWSETWGAISGAPSRAMVRQASGTEAWRFDRINAEVQLMVVTRYTETLTTADRVIIRGKAHNIRVLNNLDFGDRWLEIGASGGVAS